jgi:hypothetical protein
MSGSEEEASQWSIILYATRDTLVLHCLPEDEVTILLFA